jgi:hypothetical protein
MKNSQTGATIEGRFLEETSTIQTSQYYLLHNFVSGIPLAVAG